MRPYPRVLAVGDSALTVELGDGITPELCARVRGLDLALGEAPFPGFREAVPTYRSLLVLYDPARIGFSDLRKLMLERAAAPPAPSPAGALHEIPTRYGGEDGPDLAEVARTRGLSEAEVVTAHSSVEYTAFMLGFVPGFAYLGVLPEALEMPRRATPRARVAPGSVAIAGRQTAVYPSASAGGWHLLGRTSWPPFDPFATSPARIAPGDRVRFVPTRELPEVGTRTPPSANAPPVIEVLDPGLFTTIQDAGRPGHRRLGVPAAGPLDVPAFRAANRILGNPVDAAALECTLAGPVLRFLRPVRFAIAGADLGPVLERADLDVWPVPVGRPVLARPGNVLSFRERRAGCRAYLALAGGVEMPPVLGSRSSFGGIPLRAGDGLGVGAAPGTAATPPPPRSIEEVPTVRVVLGPQDDHITEASLFRLFDETWRLLPTSDRVGCRLAGRRLDHRGPAEITTDGMVPGCIQVPPDGQPIVMMADGPTTGGYPKVATVVSADLPRLAQLVPGEGRLRFTRVSPEGSND